MSRFWSRARVVGFTAVLTCGEAAADFSLVFGQESDQNPNAISVTGTERLEWDQPAASPTYMAGLQFVIYVDQSRFSAQSVECDQEPGPKGFRCSSVLPPMTPGPHFVEVSALRVTTEPEESPRSVAINLIMRGPPVEPSRTSPAESSRTFVTVDGVVLTATLLATGFVDAIDVAVLGSGRIAIAERTGRLRAFEPDGRILDLVQTLPDLDSSAPGSGLLALAAGGRFNPTGAVFVLYSTAKGARLTRYIANDDGLTARAILLDGLPLSRSHPRASLRIGPDQLLYLGLDDGGEPERVGDLGSLAGKVLRLNPDGTTPVDAVGRSYAIGMHQPTAMAWSSDPSMFWLAGLDAAGNGGLQQQTAAAANKEPRRFVVPMSMGDLTMVHYRRERRSPLNGNLLIAGSHAPSILRAQISPTGSIETTEWLFDDLIAGVRNMVMDNDGVIYACTANSLIRIAVQN